MPSRTSFLSGALPADRPTFPMALARWLRACTERRAQRRALARLDDDRLRDIGRTRAEALAEAAKPFWRR